MFQNLSAEYDLSQHLFRSLGFSRLIGKDGAAFEHHLLEASKFVVLVGDAMVQITGLEFYTAHQDTRIELADASLIRPDLADSSLILGGRRFRWNNHAGRVSTKFPFDQVALRSLTEGNLPELYPLGIVTKDLNRVSQIKALGEVTEREYCTSVAVKDKGEVRLYHTFDIQPVIAGGVHIQN